MRMTPAWVPRCHDVIRWAGAVFGLSALTLAGPCLASGHDAEPITIYHVNDMHARLTPHQWLVPQRGTNATGFEPVGGGALLAAKMLQLKAAATNALVLDAGDISEGNPLGDLRGNGAMVDFMNLLDRKLKALGGRGIDASVVGNHDVRFLKYIMNLKEHARYPVISMNLCRAGTRTPFFEPYRIVQAGSTRIGILGYTTEQEQIGPDATNLVSLIPCDWSSDDPGRIHVRDYVSELRTSKGCDLVVFLAHAGESAICQGNSECKPLLVDDGAVRLPEVVVAGHWHSWTETAWQPAVLNYKTLLVESASFMKYIGRLVIGADGKFLAATNIVVRDEGLAPVAEVSSLLASLEAEYSAQTNFGYALTNWPLHAVVGYTADDLYLGNNLKWWSPDDYPWDGDNSAGDWICDSIQWKARQLYTHCDLALEAGGGIRADVPAGPITFLQIFETFPWYDDLLWVIDMTGREIWHFIKATGCKAGVSRGWLITAHNGIPTRITYDGKPLEFDRTYQVAINNFMYANPPVGVVWSDPAPRRSSFLCRDAIVQYTRQFTATNAMRVGGSRYRLDNQYAGGFRAVVTMVNRSKAKVSHDVAYARLLAAAPETLARRGTPAVPLELVNADGSINASNRLASIQWFRGYLGFSRKALQPGDIVMLWGKGSFHGGAPEFVENEGILGDGREFDIVGHDESLARPEPISCIKDMLDEDHLNHFVTLLASKADAHSVMDSAGTLLLVHEASGQRTMTLPGPVGGVLRLTGVPSRKTTGPCFRCNQVAPSAGTNSAVLVSRP